MTGKEIILKSNSPWGRRAMNKEDALRRLPSVCTTAVTIATDFMQVMHVHNWTSMGTGDLTCRLGQGRCLRMPWEDTSNDQGITNVLLIRGFPNLHLYRVVHLIVLCL